MERLENEASRLDRKNSKFKEIYQTKFLGEKERLKVEKVYKFFRNYLSNIEKKDFHDQIMKKMKSRNKLLKVELSKKVGNNNGPLMKYLEDIWSKRF